MWRFFAVVFVSGLTFGGPLVVQAQDNDEPKSNFAWWQRTGEHRDAAVAAAKQAEVAQEGISAAAAAARNANRQAVQSASDAEDNAGMALGLSVDAQEAVTKAATVSSTASEEAAAAEAAKDVAESNAEAARKAADRGDDQAAVDAANAADQAADDAETARPTVQSAAIAAQGAADAAVAAATGAARAADAAHDAHEKARNAYDIVADADDIGSLVEAAAKAAEDAANEAGAAEDAAPKVTFPFRRSALKLAEQARAAADPARAGAHAAAEEAERFTAEKLPESTRIATNRAAAAAQRAREAADAAADAQANALDHAKRAEQSLVTATAAAEAARRAADHASQDASRKVIELADDAKSAAREAISAAASAVKNGDDAEEHARTVAKYACSSCEAVKSAKAAQDAAKAAREVAPTEAQIDRQRRDEDYAAEAAGRAGKAAHAAAVAAGAAADAAKKARDAADRAIEADHAGDLEAAVGFRMVVRTQAAIATVATAQAANAAGRADAAATVASQAATRLTIREGAAVEARKHADSAAAANAATAEAAERAKNAADAAGKLKEAVEAADMDAATAGDAGSKARKSSEAAQHAAETVSFPPRSLAAEEAARAAATASEAETMAREAAAKAKQAGESLDYDPYRANEVAMEAAASAKVAAAVAEAAAERAMKAAQTAPLIAKNAEAAKDAAVAAKQHAANALESFSEATTAAQLAPACHVRTELADTGISIMSRLGKITRRFPVFVDVSDFIGESAAGDDVVNELQGIEHDVAVIAEVSQRLQQLALNVESLPEEAAFMIDINDELTKSLHVVTSDVEVAVDILEGFMTMLRSRLERLPDGSPAQYRTLDLLDTASMQKKHLTNHGTELASILKVTLRHHESLGRYYEDLLAFENCVVIDGRQTRLPIPVPLVFELEDVEASYKIFEERWSETLNESLDDEYEVDRLAELRSVATKLRSNIDNVMIALKEALEEIRDNLRKHGDRQPETPDAVSQGWSRKITHVYIDDQTHTESLTENWVLRLSHLQRRIQDLDRYLEAVDAARQATASLAVVRGLTEEYEIEKVSEDASCGMPGAAFFVTWWKIIGKLGSIDVDFRAVIDRDWNLDFDQDVNTMNEIKMMLDEQLDQFVSSDREQQIAREVDMMIDEYDLLVRPAKAVMAIVSAPVGDAYRALGEVVSMYRRAFDDLQDHDLKGKMEKRGRRAMRTRDDLVRYGRALSVQLGSAVGTIESLKRYRNDLRNVENCAIEDGRRVRRPAPINLLKAEEGLDKEYDTYYGNVEREVIEAGGELTDMIDQFTERIARHIEDIDERYQGHRLGRADRDVRWEDSIDDLYESDLDYAESLMEEWERRSGRVGKTTCQVTIDILDPDDARVRSCQKDDSQIGEDGNGFREQALPPVQELR